MSQSSRGPSRRSFLIGAAITPVVGLATLKAASVMAQVAPSTQQADYKEFTTSRHRTAYIDIGPNDGPMIFFLHGWPHMGLSWRPQLAHFAAAGWRCIAPDLRGYGGSSAPTGAKDYEHREVVADMIELHDALGGQPALWVGHSLGSAISWAMATHHPERCLGVVNFTVPHLARGVALPNFVPLVDRKIYPAERYPFGQWDYMQFCNEHFTKAVRDFEAHSAQVVDMFYTPGTPDGVGKPSPLSKIREQGGWFPAGSETAGTKPTNTLLPAADRKVMLDAFGRNGFSGPTAWYINDAANIAFAAEGRDYGRITLPVLFFGGQWDTVCDTAYGRLCEPMREDCSNLTEHSLAAGHMVMLEKPDEVHNLVDKWITAQNLTSR